MAIGMITYNAANRREDLTDIIGNVTPKATPLYSGLGKTSASNTQHEWSKDAFASSGDNALAEASTFTTADLTSPQRETNVTQIVRKVITVSDTEQAVNHAGLDSMLAYQTQKGMVELAKDIEKALVAGTRASGDSGVARRMDGIIAFITTNCSANNSGTSFTETLFNENLADIYNQTDDVDCEVYTGQYLKRTINAFTTGATKYVESTDKRLVSPVDVYESEFGVHKLFKHREVPSGGVLYLDRGRHSIAVLRPVKKYEAGRTGNFTQVALEGEITLESHNEASSGYYSGYWVG